MYKQIKRNYCISVDIVRNAYRVWVQKVQGKRLLWRPRRRWDDNIKMALKKTGCEHVN